MFEKILKKTIHDLEAAQQANLLEAFVLIGGLAVSFWSNPRATGDIDIAISAQADKLSSLAKTFGGKYRKGDIRDPLLGSISIEKIDANGVTPVQLLIFPPAWEKVIFQDIVVRSIDNVQVPVISWISLVLIKLYAGAAIDIQDAVNILNVVNPKQKDLVVLKKKAGSLRVSKRLDKVLKLVG